MSLHADQTQNLKSGFFFEYLFIWFDVKNTQFKQNACEMTKQCWKHLYALVPKQNEFYRIYVHSLAPKLRAMQM